MLDIVPFKRAGSMKNTTMRGVKAFLLASLYVCMCFCAIASAVAAGNDEAETFFELKVRPVLSKTCFPCHGGKKTSGGLRVDSRESLLKGGDRGAALIPGDFDRSLIIRAVRHGDEEIEMPPGKTLPAAVVADLSQWVARGAYWPERGDAKADSSFQAERHWAFEPVRAVDPPADPSHWSDHPIDQFLMKAWKDRGLHPVADADRRTLIRRLSFDLIGLPPTLKEIHEFLSDKSVNAYDRLVERLLASPRYGERWGRYWMDVVRYADTAGDNADYPIPEIRLYRDYLIDAFNADKPYDEMIREQLAGDVLAVKGARERYAERVIATGFLALSRRYATGPEELWHLTLENAIETTGEAFLGLTLRCARCHDHKFDPISTSDYYALYGIYASTRFPYAGSEEFHSKKFPRDRFVPLVPEAEAKPKLEARLKRIGEIEAALREIATKIEAAASVGAKDAAPKSLVAKDTASNVIATKEASVPNKTEKSSSDRSADSSKNPEHEQNLKKLEADAKRLRSELETLRRSGAPSDLPVAYAVWEGSPHDEAIQLQGEPARRGKIAPRGVPEFLSGSKPTVIESGSSGRLEYANWLASPENPLTARVMINRIWERHFGRGIVATPSNFGLRGDPPTNPQLLDWLAARFIAEEYSIKAMHRLIVTSRTYRLASFADASNSAIDPENRYQWRFNRRRLDAEALRDAMLFVAGTLDLGRPGAHPFPPIDQWAWTQHNPFRAVYPSNHRSVYLMTQRFQRHPYLAIFDGPDANDSTPVRDSSTVPLQSLYFLNNPFVLERAREFAERLFETEAGVDDRERIARGFEFAFGRSPSEAEISQSLAYIKRFEDETRALGSDAEAKTEARTSFAKLLLISNEFFYID